VARDKRRGIPAGANPLYHTGEHLHAPEVVSGWRSSALSEGLGTRLVTYADDIVICAGGATTKRRLLHRLREIMSKLKRP